MLGTEKVFRRTGESPFGKVAYNNGVPKRCLCSSLPRFSPSIGIDPLNPSEYAVHAQSIPLAPLAGLNPTLSALKDEPREKVSTLLTSMLPTYKFPVHMRAIMALSQVIYCLLHLQCLSCASYSITSLIACDELVCSRV